MSEPGPRFCPRCGTGRVSGMPFCPGCGLNLAELRDEEAVAASAAGDTSARELSAPTERVEPADAPVRPREYEEERSRRGIFGPLLVAAIIAAVVLALGITNALGPITINGRPIVGAAPPSPTPSPSPTFAGPTLAPTSEAPPFGLAILSPTQGAVVASKQIVVIGSAPAGLRVVRDVPLWIDQSTTADGTGHWALTVELNKGENKLRFRLGDDKSTAKELRVVYSPPGG